MFLSFLNYEELKSLGATPLQIITAYAVVHGVVFFKAQLAKQQQTREDWHNETRQRVEKLEKEYSGVVEGFRTCEIIRSAQEATIKSLTEDVSRYENCYSKTCPFKPRGTTK